MKALIVEDIDALRSEKTAGAIQYRFRGDGALGGIAFFCPCGCGGESYLPAKGYGHSQEWEWDGNREAPTLTPSVQQVGGCQWHGWLRGGEWVSC
jgi:hypothetical protein